MSNELEKLKSDLKKLYAAHAVTLDMNCENIAVGIKSLCNVVEIEIGKQNDPWAIVKNTINYWIEHPSANEAFERTVAEYVRYLENQVSDNKSDYYCLKNDKGEVYKHLFNTVAIFATLEEAEFAAKHISDPGFEASVYTRNS